VFVTSANFTDAAWDRNIEVVVGVPDRVSSAGISPILRRSRDASERSSASRPGSGCDEWKWELEAALERAGEIVTAGGAEFAEDIVEVMDLYRAGRVERSLRSFADELRAALKLLP